VRVPSINNDLKGRLVCWIWWKFASACPGSKDMRWKFLRPNPISRPQYYIHTDKEETSSNKNEMSLLFYNYGSRKVLSRNVARFAKGFLQKGTRSLSVTTIGPRFYHIKRIDTNIKKLAKSCNQNWVIL
jgi:hypothetical protein